MDNEDELDRMRAQRRRSGGTKRNTEEGRGDRTYHSIGPGRNPRVGRTVQPGREADWEYEDEYTDQPARDSRDGYMARQAVKTDSGRGAKSARGPKRRSAAGNSSVQQKLREERMRKKKKKKRMLLIELIVLVVLVSGAFFVFGKGTNQKGYWTIAVFGVDSRDGNLEKGALSDVEMICNIDKATGEIKLVSVYRDTYLKINSEGTYHKINEAYFKGGHKQALAALNENLDMKIDDYATFNWKSVAEAINILGGIDIEITDAEFAYINGFITETVNSTGIGSYQLQNAGMNHLDGVQAVSYARLRLMDTDFNRTERQRKVVMLALDKAKQADFGTLKTLVSTVFPQISTSIGIDDIFTIAKGITKYHIGETAGFPFSRTTMRIGKMDCVIATTLESNVIQLHQFLFNDTNYSPSSSVKSISARISEESGISEPGKNAPGGGSSTRKAESETKAPAPETAPVETETEPETTMEETTAETTEAETESTEAEESESETNDDGSLIGPGAGIRETTESTAESSAESRAESSEPAVEKEPEEGPSKASEAETPGSLPEAGPGTKGPGEAGPGV